MLKVGVSGRETTPRLDVDYSKPAYGILSDRNVGANVELVRIARRAQDGSYHM